MTMLRARRLVSAVVAASLALGGLSACRSEPAVAAYYGDSGQVSEQQVQDIWDEAYDALAAQTPDAQVQMPFTRSDIVHSLVVREIYGQMAQAHQVSLPAGLPYDEAATQSKLPADSEYVRLLVQNGVLRNLLTEKVGTSAQPAEADLRMVYDRLAAAGGVQPGTEFGAWSAGLSPQNRQLVAAAGVMRGEMQEVADDLHVKVSPRYQPFQLSLLSAGDGGAGTLDLIAASFGEDLSVPVADVS